jgi:hypothetical protein
MYFNHSLIYKSEAIAETFYQLSLVNHNNIDLVKLLGYSWVSYSPDADEKTTTFIFREENNELLVVKEGLVQKGHWEQLVLSNSLLINDGHQELLFNVVYFGNIGMILKKENLEEYLFLIKRNKKNYHEKTFEELIGLFMDDYTKVQKQFDNINLDTTESSLEFEDIGEFREYRLFPYVATLGTIVIILTILIIIINKFWS